MFPLKNCFCHTIRVALNGWDIKALLSCQWGQYLRLEARRKGKEILYLNLDESNTAAVMPDTFGTIKKLPHRGFRRLRPEIKAKTAEARVTFSLVAVICSDMAIQRVLPQVIFVSEKHITWAQTEMLWGKLPPNVYLKRKKGKNLEAPGRGKRALQGPFLFPFPGP